MANTNTRAQLVKKAVFDGLAAAPDLAGVNVDYAYKASNHADQYVYGGKMTSQINYANMTSARKPRDEHLAIDVHITVRKPGGDVVDTDARAVEIGGVVETLLADNVTLAGIVTGLRWGGVTGIDMTYALDDDAVETEAVYHLTFSSRLI